MALAMESPALLYLAPPLHCQAASVYYETNIADHGDHCALPGNAAVQPLVSFCSSVGARSFKDRLVRVICVY
jgi:hypothetical protein